MILSKVIIIDTFGDGHTVAEYTTIEEIEKVFKSDSLIGTTEMYTIDDTCYDIEEVTFRTTPELTVEICVHVKVLQLTD
jgi:hypothetical protein